MSAKDELDKALNDQFRRNHPNVPEYAIPKRKKSDSESVQLQNDIEAFMKSKGNLCEQIQTKGTFRKGIGYTAGHYTRGSADVHAVVFNGRIIVWFIEVKIGNDKQSEDQKKYQAYIEKFQARIQSLYQISVYVKYSIVKSYDDFINQFNAL